MSELSFAQIVQEAVRLLMERYQWHLVSSQNYRVRYESECVFVEFHYDRIRSFELDLVFGKYYNGHDQPMPPFSLGELLRWKKAPDASLLGQTQVSGSAELRDGVLRQCELFAKYGACFLEAPKECFPRLLKFREQEVLEYALSKRIRVARLRATKAWDDGDYESYLQIMKPHILSLSGVELKRYEIALKRLRG